MLVYWMLQIWPTSPIEQLAVAAHKVIDSRKNPLTSPDALCSHRSHRAIDWKQPAAQTGGTVAPLWLSPSAPLASPSSAQLHLSGPSGRCRSHRERSLRRPAGEEHLPFRLRLINPPLCPHPSFGSKKCE